jgi:hypothetical protein
LGPLRAVGGLDWSLLIVMPEHAAKIMYGKAWGAQQFAGEY